MQEYKEIIVNDKVYQLSLEYILGFFEGDGSITIQLKPNPRHKTGKQAILIFEIHQHTIDKELLEAMSIFLGIGKIEVSNKRFSENDWIYRLRVSSQKDIFGPSKLLSILSSKSMILKKRHYDITIFLEACKIVESGRHTSLTGQLELQRLASSLSSKLSLEIKRSLPNTLKPLNKDWITGITDAEGNFYFTIYDPKSKTSLLANEKMANADRGRRKKEVVFSAETSITQENSEKEFLDNLVTFFGCGNVHIDNKGGGVFTVNSKKDLQSKIIPFPAYALESNPLQSVKKYSFDRFKRALDICIRNKPLLDHHFQELENILKDKDK